LNKNIEKAPAARRCGRNLRKNFGYAQLLHGTFLTSKNKKGQKMHNVFSTNKDSVFFQEKANMQFALFLE
jgi:selenocysteine-specific translation elongation factor